MKRWGPFFVKTAQLFINLRAKRGGSLFEAGSERDRARGVPSVRKGVPGHLVEAIVAGQRNSDRRSVFASRRYWRGLFWARALTARVIAREARRISANFSFGQKELSQGDEIRTEGPSLPAAGSGMVCFGLSRAQRA